MNKQMNELENLFREINVYLAKIADWGYEWINDK